MYRSEVLDCDILFELILDCDVLLELTLDCDVLLDLKMMNFLLHLTSTLLLEKKLSFKTYPK